MRGSQATAGLLSSHGLRRTAAREAVLTLLLERGEPLSHADIRRAVGRSADRVTLYRTLEALHRARLVHQVLGEDGVWRYCSHDPAEPGCPGNHPHFLCLRCGRMVCLKDQPLPRVRVPARFEVKSKQLVLFGRCSACRRAP